MGCHRLLQRGFAHLYSYSLSKTHDDHDDDDGFGGVPALRDDQSLAEYDKALLAQNAKDLHFKMKGASC